MRRVYAALAILLAAAPAALAQDDEPYLKNVRQLTKEGEFSKAGEAYFNADGTKILFQAIKDGHPYYQIYVMNADGSGARLVSPGKGKTTCAFFQPGNPDRFIYASTHLDPETYIKREPKDKRRRYKWDYDHAFDIFAGSLETGKITARLTEGKGYDAEASFSHDGKTICYTVRREGKPDQIWLMDADGKNKRALIANPELACGGPFFSPDDKWVLYRAIKEGSYVMHSYLTSVDGKQTRKLTTLPRVNWAPYFHPAGDVVAYGANMPDDRANFDVVLVKADGSGREVQITFNKKFDGLPTFHPNGKQILWTSKRGGGDSQVYIADLVMPPETAFVVPKAPPPGAHGPPGRPGGKKPTSQPADQSKKPAEKHPGSAGEATGMVSPNPGIVVKRPILELKSIKGEEMMKDIVWLADDARAGRRAGTPGCAAAGDYIAKRFEELGLKGAGPEGSFFHPFDFSKGGKITKAVLGVTNAKGEALEHGKQFQALIYSSSGAAEGKLVFAGYGIRAEEEKYDDFASIDLKDAVALVMTGAPKTKNGGAFGKARPTVYQDLRYKIAACRDAGAKGVILVRSSGEGWLSLSSGDPGIPVAQVTPQVAKDVFGIDVSRMVVGIDMHDMSAASETKHTVRLEVAVERTRTKSRNVMGKITGKGNPHEAIVIGAHYDHLGMGGEGSLAPDKKSVHNGADDNASGVAALFALAKAWKLIPPQRTIIFVAFGAEEEGLIGSQRFVKTFSTDRIVAMLNMDMIGRLWQDPLLIGGYGTAKQWPALIQAIVDYTGETVSVQHDGFGPSDHASFYAAGVPVFFLWTGTHADYHKPSDDSDIIDEEGLQHVARVAFLLSRGIDAMSQRPKYIKVPRKARPKPVATGEKRASFGSIPNYAAEGVKGVLLDGAREGSPAAAAGVQKGDVVVEFNGMKIMTIHDYVNALRLAKAGQKIKVVVEREGKRITLEATLK